jgi:hypothetical protein
VNIDINAKPIQWEEEPDGNWFERDHGFYIQYDPDELPDFRYCAYWGESDDETFASLYEAKKWCQDKIDGYILRYAVVTPNVCGNRLAP